MAARASRRERATDIPPDVYVAIARDPEGFDRKLDAWEARRTEAVVAETSATAALTAAKAEQDALAKDRAAFNTQQTADKAKLAADRGEFNALAKAENTRLVALASELADIERRQAAENARLEALAGTIATNFRESETARAASAEALQNATIARNAALTLKTQYETAVDKVRKFGVELQA